MPIGTKNLKYRRKQYLVSKRFQLKYAGIILALMFATAALSSYVVYYTSLLLMGEKLANVYPQGQLVHIVKTVNLRLLASILLVSPLVIALGIYLSHKIAGPIFRIERFMNDMASGDFSSRIVLRKGDELVGLANGINSLCDSVKVSMTDQRARLTKILDDAVALREKTQDPIGSERLENEIIEVLKEIDKYKV